MNFGFAVHWSRSNGDLWLFESSGMTAQQLVDLVLQAKPGSATAVELPTGSMTFLASESGEDSRSRFVTYTVAGLAVQLAVRNDGGAFGNIVLSKDSIRSVSVAGLNGFEGRLSNGQVELVWDAGGGWWGSLLIHPGVATRADEIIQAIEPRSL